MFLGLLENNFPHMITLVWNCKNEDSTKHEWQFSQSYAFLLFTMHVYRVWQELDELSKTVNNLQDKE